MKTILLSTAALTLIAGRALAADPVVYEPVPEPPAAVQAYDWTGPYIGVFGGLAVGEMEYAARQIFADGNPPPQETDLDISAGGFLGGVQVGYDWQFAERWVIGAVADIAVTNYGASVTASVNGAEVFDGESQVKYLGTVRARLGHAWDRTLVYAHGGFAYGKTELDVTVGGTNILSESQTRTGWTVGAGFEFAVTDKVSLGSEYAYVDLGSEHLFDNGEGLTVKDDVAFHTLKAFLNYRF